MRAGTIISSLLPPLVVPKKAISAATVRSWHTRADPTKLRRQKSTKPIILLTNFVFSALA
jgi:hypothetical protein